MKDPNNPPHPTQPIVVDKHGTHRFKENGIVRALLETGTLDLNKIAIMNFSQEDRVQFAQLIGYSLSGVGDLSYVSSKDYRKGYTAQKRMFKRCKNS